MNRRLITALIVAVSCLTLSAQGRDGAESYRHKKGDVQMSLVFGKGSVYSNYKFSGLIPGTNTFLNSGTSVGVTDPAYYLEIGGNSDINSSSVSNMAGVQVKWFVHDRWDVNFSAALDFNMTPKKDYQEGVEVSPGLNIPNMTYVHGKITNTWAVDVGTNYYFLPKHERLTLYVGAVLGHRMGYIQQQFAYTGQNVNYGDGDNPIELYVPADLSGAVYGLKAAAVAGGEYAITDGLVLGLEISPVTYYYNVLAIHPKVTGTFQASHHDIAAFANPQIRLGFRF